MSYGKFYLSFMSSMVMACCAIADDMKAFSDAAKLSGDGKFKEAYEAYVKLLDDPKNSGRLAADIFNGAVYCLSRLNRIGEFDALLKKTLATRKDDWRFVSNYHYPMSNGYILDGKFTRGWNRGGQARYIDVRFADLLAQTKLMVRNMPPVEERDSYEFYKRLAGIFSNLFGNGFQGPKTILTDLTQEPDYLNSHVMGSMTDGTPVDADGNPVFFLCPKSFEEAKNDGERVVWAYQMAAKCNIQEIYRIYAKLELVTFYKRLYGVETIMRSGFFNRRGRQDDEAFRDSIFALETLKDNETIAKLATGIKRFNLPDECNPIVLNQRLVETIDQSKHLFHQPYVDLAEIYENRCQYEKALIWWRKYLELVDKPHIDKSSAENARNSIRKITGNWCRIDDVRKQIAGEMGSLRFTFRNGTKANFTLQRIDMDQIVADCQEYLANLKGRGNDWNQRNFTNLAWRLYQMDGGEKKYLKETTATWSMDVTPAEKYKDRTVPLPLPAQKAGWYLLTCTMENGANTARVPVYFADTEIVEKQLKDGKKMWQVLDAKSGQPLANEKVEFFVLSTWWNDKTKRAESAHSRFAEMTDDEGKIVKSTAELFEGHKDKNGEVQIVLKNDAGRRAWYSTNGFFNGRMFEENFPENQTRAFFLTDRPVY
ncbi:MAG: hypothetical protein IKZ84_16055, partial [Victivallales bacterium]|nr:hypothetical protein [Victivallales bacterium]